MVPTVNNYSNNRYPQIIYTIPILLIVFIIPTVSAVLTVPASYYIQLFIVHLF